MNVFQGCKEGKEIRPRRLGEAEVDGQELDRREASKGPLPCTHNWLVWDGSSHSRKDQRGGNALDLSGPLHIPLCTTGAKPD